jgi:negative regulator of sigma E activity
MTPHENRLSCRRAQVLLEAYADGELGTRRRAQLEAHLATCFTCSQELAHARRVRDTLRALPERFCDEALMEEVAARIQREPRPVAEMQGSASLAARMRRWFAVRALPAWQPAVAVLALLLVVFGVGRILFLAPREQKITPADVQRAELQVRWVMAHLGEISRQTGQTVQKDVLNQGVAAPTAHAVEEVLQGNVTQ